jgi:hypothetical protein
MKAALLTAVLITITKPVTDTKLDDLDAYRLKTYAEVLEVVFEKSQGYKGKEEICVRADSPLTFFSHNIDYWSSSGHSLCLCPKLLQLSIRVYNLRINAHPGVCS